MSRSQTVSPLWNAFVLTLSSAGLLLTVLPCVAGQKDHQMSDMAGMDMSNKNEMRKMGPSMAAMAGHMIMTPLRPMEPGDEERAKAVVDAARAAMERYRDYHQALADGYVILRPDVKQPQYHFTNDENGKEAEVRFDPSKPTSLLYRRTPHQMYKLEGVMYTARVHETEEELDRRIPLSIGRWHQHTNFCEAPPDRPNEYMGPHPTFGLFGSIKTKEACDAARGTFYPYLFNWMIHVFPYENDLKDVFSVNDDVAHVH
jgi:hypothetical protein